ncbi:hypothetical protein CRG98_018121 [Punica granatum]|uniref:Protein MHF1 homolog n=1 Tax=Punica granatum TaxID=22663 RepID=A0A2I0K1A9_PUNGR|nr:hypothetical protein CRG98_018121 [Punica granatum]
MDGGKEGGGEEEESAREALRDRLRLSSISIAQSQALRDGMDVSEPVLACIADLSFKYAEQLAIDVEQFVRHAGRNNMMCLCFEPLSSIAGNNDALYYRQKIAIGVKSHLAVTQFMRPSKTFSST